MKVYLSWWVTADDEEFTRRARIEAVRMASDRPPAGVDRYLDQQTDRGSWRLPSRKKEDGE